MSEALSSAKITGMSFAVKLDADSVSVEPGGSVPVALDVVNDGLEADRFELTVEGVDHEWVTIPVPSFVIEAKSGQTHRFFIRPPRESHSMAGNYPFVVRIRSLETGNSLELQGTVEVKSYAHLSVDVQPRKVTVSPFRRSARMTVNVANMGNVEQTLQLFATDTDDVIAFEFDKDQIRVSPGQQANVELIATAGASPFLANPRLQPVTLSARSVSNASQGASTSLQVEQRGAFSVANAAAIFVLAAIVVAWYVTRPKSPTIDSLSPIPMNPTVGDTVQIKWVASNATSVELNVGGKLNDKQPPSGEISLVTSIPGKITVIATPVADGRKGEPSYQIIDVQAKKVAPDPQIVSFSAKPSTAKVGETVTINYQVSDAVTTLYLSPLGPLDPKGNGYTFRPDKPGDVALKLTAHNADSKVVEQDLTIHVIQVSEAVISSFTASTKTIEGNSGPVVLSWAIDKSANATISYNGKTVPASSPSGTMTVQISETTSFTLSVTDSQGVATTKKVRVIVNAPAPVETSPPPDGKSDPPGTLKDKTGDPTPPVSTAKPKGTAGAEGSGNHSPKMPGGKG